MTIDSKGRTVSVGSTVKVLRIDPSITQYLPDEEKRDISSMLGEIFEVYRIDECGKAWVEKWWDRGGGMTESHSLGLLPAEMELAKDAS